MRRYKGIEAALKSVGIRRFKEQADPNLVSFFLDVACDDAEQDWFHVVKSVACVAKLLKTHFPHLDKMFIVWDRAPYYMATSTVNHLAHIGKWTGLKVEELNTSNSGDGKTVVDGHFARSKFNVGAHALETHEAVDNASKYAAALNARPLPMAVAKELQIPASERKSKPLPAWKNIGLCAKFRYEGGNVRRWMHSGVCLFNAQSQSTTINH